MNLTYHQRELLNDVLLKMRYNPKQTLSENLLKEQETTQSNVKLDTRNMRDRLTDNEAVSIAQEWGWTQPKEIPIMLTDDKKFEMIVSSARNFLKEIKWPKFGMPPNSVLGKTNPEFSVKSSRDKLYAGAEGSPMGVTSAQNQPGYNECVSIFEGSLDMTYLTNNQLQAYENVYEYCKYNYEKYKPKKIGRAHV